MYHYLSQSLTAAQPSGGGLEEQNISGALSGTYAKKRYFIVGECTVASGVDVAFAAGSVLEFMDYYRISVIGQIQLNGTASERITVKAHADNPAGSWGGILLCTNTNDFTFSGGENGTINKFTYCDFSSAAKVNATTGNYHVTRGAAIFAFLYEYIEINQCTFTQCVGWDYGGTVYLHQETAATTIFTNCVFDQCQTANEAAGAWVVTHGGYTISGMTYTNVSASYGVDMTYTVNLSTNTFTSAEHFMITGNIVKFKTNANAPAPLVAGVEYYAIPLSATTFWLANSYSNAVAANAIDITAQATGTKIMNQLQEFSAFDASVSISA